MRSGAFLWNKLVLCADLEGFLADMQSDMLAELQLSPVPSLNDEELTRKSEEILVATSEPTALGSCRPIVACTCPTGIGNCSALPSLQLLHSILLSPHTHTAYQNPTKLLSNTGTAQTASGGQDMDESLSQSLFCTLGRWLEDDCLWAADTHLNALVTVSFLQAKRNPWRNNHYQALTFNRCCEEVAGLALLLLSQQQEISQAWQGAGGKKELFQYDQKGKCFLLWFPKGNSILAEATCPPGQSVLLRFLSKAIQANSGPFTRSIQLNIFDLGFFSLFILQGDYSDALSAPSSVPGSSMECLSACSIVSRFPCCINHCTDQLPQVSS